MIHLAQQLRHWSHTIEPDEPGIAQLMRYSAGEIERLTATIDRIPRTADGHPVIPGDAVWHVRGDVYSGIVTSLDNDGHIETTAHGDAPGACYHHYAAARAALEKKP